MKLANPLKKSKQLITAPPGMIISEDSEKRVLEKGTIVESKGRKWKLKCEVEIESV